MAEVTQFDFPAAIKELAEAERECPGYDALSKGTTLEIPLVEGHPMSCVCRGTGRIVLFPPLRVVKQGLWLHQDCKELDQCDLVLTDGSMLRNTTDCQGRGWVPEPDVEKALCRLILFRMEREVATGLVSKSSVGYDIEAKSWCWWDEYGKSHLSSLKEAEFCAALAWVKEQHG